MSFHGKCRLQLWIIKTELGEVTLTKDYFLRRLRYFNLENSLKGVRGKAELAIIIIITIVL